MASVVITAFALILSSFVMGLTGFGFAMAAISIMSLIAPLKNIIAFIFPYNVVMNVFLILRLHRHISLKRVYVQLLCFFPGAVIGSYFLINWPDDVLKMFVGITLILFCLVSSKRPLSSVASPRNVWAGLSGFAGGILGGALYMPGPPVIMYHAATQKDRFLFTVELQLFFLLGNVLLLIPYTGMDLFSLGGLKQNLFYLPCVCIGFISGLLVFKSVPNHLFGKITTLLIGALGVGIFLRAAVQG